MSVLLECNTGSSCASSAIIVPRETHPVPPSTQLCAHNLQRTYIMVKPDGVQRGLVGEIIKRFEQKGFKLVAMKLVHASKAHMEVSVPAQMSSRLIRGKSVRLRSLTFNTHFRCVSAGALRRPEGEEVLPRSGLLHDLWPCRRHGLGGQGLHQDGTHPARRHPPRRQHLRHHPR